MKIAFLGWGSLIWDPRNLQITGSWETDGPLLPVEFARVSQDGILTLVLYPDVSVLWARAAHRDLQQAIDNLRRREGTSTNRIGFLFIPDNCSRCNVIPTSYPASDAGRRRRNSMRLCGRTSHQTSKQGPKWSSMKIT